MLTLYYNNENITLGKILPSNVDRDMSTETLNQTYITLSMSE